MDPPAALVARRPVRARVGVGAAIVLVLVGLGIAVLVSAVGTDGATQSVAPTAPSTPGVSGAPRSASGGVTIYVHILGAVAKPGLYLLRDGDRAVDAIAAAGGFSPAAEQAGLNLARPLVDGEQILVPAVGEAPVIVPGATSPGGKVNINTADEAALDSLPRVGPSMAARIIAYRDANGRFTVIEDLMNVTGVGVKTFEGMRDLVTV